MEDYCTLKSNCAERFDIMWSLSNLYCKRKQVLFPIPMFNKRNKITFKADNTYDVIALFFTRSFNLWKEKTFSDNLEIGKRCDVRKRKIMWGLTLSHGLLHAFCKRKEGNLHNYCSKMKLYGVVKFIYCVYVLSKSLHEISFYYFSYSCSSIGLFFSGWWSWPKVLSNNSGLGEQTIQLNCFNLRAVQRKSNICQNTLSVTSKKNFGVKGGWWLFRAIMFRQQLAQNDDRVFNFHLTVWLYL